MRYNEINIKTSKLGLKLLNEAFAEWVKQDLETKL